MIFVQLLLINCNVVVKFRCWVGLRVAEYDHAEEDNVKICFISTNKQSIILVKCMLIRN